MANFDLTMIIVSFKGLLPLCLSPEPKTLMLETVFLFHLSNNIMPSFTLGIGFLPCPNLIFFFTLKTLDYLILALIFSSPLSSCYSLLPFPLFTSLLLSMENIWDYSFLAWQMSPQNVCLRVSVFLLTLILPTLISYTGLWPLVLIYIRMKLIFYWMSPGVHFTLRRVTTKCVSQRIICHSL